MSKDRELGMDRKITRRDFIEGASVAIAGSMIPGSLLAETGSQSAGTPHYYPPGQSGMRGSHVGSFEVAHQLARERRTDWGPAEDAVISIQEEHDAMAAANETLEIGLEKTDIRVAEAKLVWVPVA